MIHQLFASFKDLPIAVVGDVMLDTYWWGSTDRISPEAPVPVVALREVEYRIGGAGNVALNLAALGARVSMHAVVGADDDGSLLQQLMQQQGIQTEGIQELPGRETTNKIRVISRSQHLLRLDKETTAELDADQAASFIQATLAAWEKTAPVAVIFEDYNKGVLTVQVIEQLIAWCRAHQVITTVDPKRKNFFAYRGVTIFKPNLKESKEALNLLDIRPTAESLSRVHAALQDQLAHQISLITLSEHGMFYQQQGQPATILPAHLRNIADVSGAGDTVIAVATLVYAATGGNLQLAAEISNLAGGLVCEEVGTVAIDPAKLLEQALELMRKEERQLSDG